ncbi:MAG TPA: OsmC family protein [Terriglobia bacterium]|nr:OsmC family protein [Terriglobia bacterium]
MPIRNAEAEWKGNLIEGQGHMKLGSGSYEGAYTFRSRMENGPGTNPEELIAAAHAGCFSMALSAGLTKGGHTPKRVHTTAAVHFDKVGEGFAITGIDLNTEAEVSGIDASKFQEFAEGAKKNCPVSKALAGTTINLKATLVQAKSV